MGLAISVHSYAYALTHSDLESVEYLRKELDTINRVLAENGLPLHEESGTEGPVSMRAHAGSFPYSFVHYLRRAYAHAYINPGQPLTPVAEGKQPTGDPLIEEVMYMFECHLICHSDAEGFYVPIDFGEVLVPQDPSIKLAGGLLGSSVALLRELRYVAPYLGIELENGDLADAAATALNSYDEDHPFQREREVWLALFESARISVANKTLISFG
ncbi:hypothetical protein AB0H76_15820 [Nocardia sp. NPDC050712]|uniref:hypothetical protein n=1 Tax=Nocardia sp. NPDC050712 TaxID=3155518 RepID=UPI003407374F